MGSIYAYISQTLLAPGTALDMVGKMEDAILSLNALPFSRMQDGVYFNQGGRFLHHNLPCG